MKFNNLEAANLEIHRLLSQLARQNLEWGERFTSLECDRRAVKGEVARLKKELTEARQRPKRRGPQKLLTSNQQ